ncbi:trypco2 family protein [Roseivirga sp.]|uniref:trypco2 family protein n=1 Tax=Roseivirga sp. TaxID=1964215 RepID=UPI003B527925
MKKTILCCISLVFFTSILSAQDAVSLSDVIEETKIALLFAQSDLEGINMELQSVELSFEAVYSLKAGGGFKLLFIKAKGEQSKSEYQTISFKLTPPSKDDTVPVAKRSGSSEALKTALIQAAKEVKATTSSSGKLPLDFSELSVELKFVVKESSEPGLDFELGPIGLNLGAGGEDQNAHKLKVTYAKIKKP